MGRSGGGGGTGVRQARYFMRFRWCGVLDSGWWCQAQDTLTVAIGSYLLAVTQPVDFATPWKIRTTAGGNPYHGHTTVVRPWYGNSPRWYRKYSWWYGGGTEIRLGGTDCPPRWYSPYHQAEFPYHRRTTKQIFCTTGANFHTTAVPLWYGRGADLLPLWGNPRLPCPDVRLCCAPRWAYQAAQCHAARYAARIPTSARIPT